MRIGIYARVSYDPHGDKATIDRQRADCRRWAELHGHEVVDEYVDRDVSAYRKVRRPQFDRMLGDLGAGTVDGVCVWKLDRLVRNHRDFQRFWDIAEPRGALFASVNDSLDTSSPIGMLMVRLLVSFAEIESANNSLRTSAAMAEAARNGQRHGGVSRAFGMTQDWTALVSGEAALVQEAARRLLDGEVLFTPAGSPA